MASPCRGSRRQRWQERIAGEGVGQEPPVQLSLHSCLSGGLVSPACPDQGHSSHAACMLPLPRLLVYVGTGQAALPSGTTLFHCGKLWLREAKKPILNYSLKRAHVCPDIVSSLLPQPAVPAPGSAFPWSPGRCAHTCSSWRLNHLVNSESSSALSADIGLHFSPSYNTVQSRLSPGGRSLRALAPDAFTFWFLLFLAQCLKLAITSPRTSGEA